MRREGWLWRKFELTSLEVGVEFSSWFVEGRLKQEGYD